MLDALAAAIYVTDRDGRIVYFNPACVKFCGRVPELGTDQWCATWKLFYPNGAPMPHDECPMAIALREGRVVHGLEAIAERPDGTRVWFEPHPAPLFDDHGQVVGGINMLVEITERRQSYDAQARLAAIVESSDDAIISKDLNGVIVSWNRGAERLFGYTADEVIGQPVTMLMPPDRVNEEPSILARLRAGEKIDHYETIRQRKDGQLLDISLSISPLFDAHGRIVGASKIARDITDRKRAEQALRDADRRKDEFLATLAHELRNPLAPIQNSIELLHRVGSADLDASRARETIQRQVTHLSRLVDDLLNVSRITTGKLSLQRTAVNLTEVINAGLETCQPAIDRLGHEVSLELPRNPIWIDGDPVRLAQVISNLCNNACKYTPPKGRIWISAQRHGADVIIKVRDSGIGIPADKLDSVFDLFSQISPSLDRDQGGLGIGLHLVRRLVEMHGGSVSAASPGVGMGSEFAIRLPMLAQRPVQTDDSAPASASASPPQNTGHNRRILIVDDNRDAAQVLSRLLSYSGHETELAFDGEHAIQQALRFNPHVVLLDIGLPKLNGYEACRTILANAIEFRPHMVALTGWGQEDDRARSREAGFHAHLTKPICFDELNKLLADICKNERLNGH